jgi:hypothetical protein
MATRRGFLRWETSFIRASSSGKTSPKPTAATQKAAERGERDGYYGMVLIDEERGETEKARQDYAFALEAGFLLPGTVE